jgi:outer membrane protein, heavy metal efflux system
MIQIVILNALLAGQLLAQAPPTAAPADGPGAITIQQAVSEAIDKNLDLAAERLNITIAEAKQITARLRPNPVLTVTTSTLNVFQNLYSSDSPLGPNAITAHTDFVIERAHKRDERVAVATAEKSLAELRLLEYMRQLIFNVQGAFVDVQQAKDNLALAQSNLTSLNGIVTVNEARVRAGDLAVVELERSRVAALQYQTSVEQALLTLDQAKAKLQLLLGRRISSDPFDVTGTMRREALADAETAIRMRAETARPDVLAVQADQARSRADLRLQLANGKIDYTVGAEFTRQSAFGFGGNSMGFSFSAPLPVFNRNQGEIVRAQREIRQAEARLGALQANVDTDVNTAYRQYETSKRLLESIEKNMLGRASSVRDTTLYSYQRGEASLVEFLDAQRAYNDAVQSYNEARANFARSLYLIDSVSGASVASLSPGVAPSITPASAPSLTQTASPKPSSSASPNSSNTK